MDSFPVTQPASIKDLNETPSICLNQFRFMLKIYFSSFANDAKIICNEKKKRVLNDLVWKLCKTGSTYRTSASSLPCSSQTHENAKVFFRLARQSTSGWENLTGHFSVRKTCRITWFTLKQLSFAFVHLLFNMMQLSLVTVDDILHMFAVFLEFFNHY